MKRLAILYLLWVPIFSFAENKVLFQSFKELYFVNHTVYSSGIPQNYDGKGPPRELAEKLRTQVRPAAEAAFRDIGTGKLTPVAREILHRWTAIDYCSLILADILNTLSPDEQRAACNALFSEVSPSVGMLLLMRFYFQENIPLSLYEDSAIQNCLVNLINDGFPAGRFYFLLSDENAKRVADTARTDMMNYSRDRNNGRGMGNCFSLLSAAFLARHGDRQALKMLRTILDHRSTEDIDKILPVFPCIALTENQSLTAELLTIIRTDKRRIWIGADCIPQEISFVHEAAAVCSLVIDGFPAVREGWFFKDEQKRAVEEWVRTHPEWSLKKPDIRSMFYFGSQLSMILPEQLKALYRLAEAAYQDELGTDRPKSILPIGGGWYSYQYE